MKEYFVIKIGARYFSEIKNGRVITAHSIAGANIYLRNVWIIEQDLRRLLKRKKNPVVYQLTITETFPL